MKQLCVLFVTTYLLISGISPLSAANYSTAQVQILTSLRNNARQLDTLSSKVDYLMDNYAVMKQQINTLQQSLATERQNNQQLKREITTLRKQLSDDREQIQKSLNSVVDKVANETSKAINAAVQKTNTTSRARSARRTASSPATSGDFYKYKVQAGATLSAIAKAYGVSVSSIRKANSLDSDIIRVGQILYIPKM